MEHIICINPSKQEKNIGVSGYGNEEDNAHLIGKRVTEILNNNGGCKAYCTPKSMSLADGIAYSNAIHATVHLDIHSNANDGKQRGCLGIHKTEAGKKLIKCIYDRVSAITPTSDLGLSVSNDLGCLNQTHAVAGLIEMFFHDNVADVEFYKNHKEEFAQAIAEGIMDYCGIEKKVEKMVSPFPVRSVIASVLNVRSTPSAVKDSNIIGQLLRGDKVKVGYDRADGWSNIFYGMHGGWVATRYLK